MRFLIRLKGETPHETLLEAVKTVARALGVDPRNPKRTSYGALELDIFSPTMEDFHLFLSAIEPIARLEYAKDLNLAPAFKEDAELYAEARHLFNAERFWECHEVLEGAWRVKEGSEKRLLQGLILVCAAFVHHQKGEESVALGVLRRSVPQLDFRPTKYGGFDLAAIRENVRRILTTGRFEVFSV